MGEVPPRSTLDGWPTFLLLLVAAGAFALTFASLTIGRYAAFETSANDLGLYNQAFWNAAFGGGWYNASPGPVLGSRGFLVSGHFSPLLWSMVPVYAAVPGPSTLLALQAAGLGLGVVPAFYLAADRLGRGWGGVIAAVYLVGPLTSLTGWFDFHPEAFLPFFVLLALLFLQRGKFWPFVLALLGSLMVIETIAPLLLLAFGSLALVELWPAIRAWRRERTWPVVWTPRVKLLSVGCVTALAWLGVSLLALTLLTPLGGGFSSSQDQWSLLGATSPFEVFPTALLRPGAAGQALQFQAGLKVEYLLLLLACMGFLPLVGEWPFLVPVLGWFGLVVLSNEPALYALGDQYTAYVLPFLLVGLIGGIARTLRAAELRPPSSLVGARAPNPRRVTLGTLVDRARRRPLPSPPVVVAVLVVGALLVSTALLSPWAGAPVDPYTAVSFGVPEASAHDQFLDDVLSELPRNASVLTLPPIFPQVSDRSHAYVVPVYDFFSKGETFKQGLQLLVNESDFVVLDFVLDPADSAITLQFADLGGFGVRAAADGAYLYARGWTGPPDLWVPRVEQLPPTALNFHDASGVTTSGCSSGLGNSPGLENGTYLWDGPYASLPGPGYYTAALDLRVAAVGSGVQMGVSAFLEPQTIVAVPVPYAGNFHAYEFNVLPPSAPRALANQSVVSDRPGQEISGNLTFGFAWSGTGTFNLLGWVVSADAQVQVCGLTLSQSSPPYVGGA